MVIFFCKKIYKSWYAIVLQFQLHLLAIVEVSDMIRMFLLCFHTFYSMRIFHRSRRNVGCLCLAQLFRRANSRIFSRNYSSLFDGSQHKAQSFSSSTGASFIEAPSCHEQICTLKFKTKQRKESYFFAMAARPLKAEVLTQLCLVFHLVVKLFLCV